MEGPSGRVSPCAGSLLELAGLGFQMPGIVWCPHFPNVTNEAEAFAGDRSDEALFPTAIAYGFACRVDVTGQGQFGDDAATPHPVQQVILADDVLAVLQQIQQQIEDLRANRNRLGAPCELPPLLVEHVVVEGVLHAGTL